MWMLLKDKNNFLNLNDTARMRWRIRPRGFHELRPVIRLADGTLLAADYAEPTSTYMRVSEIYFTDIPRWRALDPNTMAEAHAKPGEGLWKYNVDLTKVDEIGFTDMMAGAGHEHRETSPLTGSKFTATQCLGEPRSLNCTKKPLGLWCCEFIGRDALVQAPRPICVYTSILAFP